MPREQILKHHFDEFFASPTKSKLTSLLREHVGEENHLDFKEDWLEAAQLCRHILAMANSGGGCLVIGVAEDDNKHLVSKGLAKIKDKSKVRQQNQKFLPSSLDYAIFDFDFAEHEDEKLKDKFFQVLMVFDSPLSIPFLAKKESGEEIRNDVVYVRDSVNSIAASHDALETIFKRRAKVQFAIQPEKTLESELGELKLLFSEIQRNFVRHKPSKFVQQMMPFASLSAIYGEVESSTPNPAYPAEDYEAFIVRMVEVKKNKIQGMITD